MCLLERFELDPDRSDDGPLFGVVLLRIQTGIIGPPADLWVMPREEIVGELHVFGSIGDVVLESLLDKKRISWTIGHLFLRLEFFGVYAVRVLELRV